MNDSEQWIIGFANYEGLLFFVLIVFFVLLVIKHLSFRIGLWLYNEKITGFFKTIAVIIQVVIIPLVGSFIIYKWIHSFSPKGDKSTLWVILMIISFVYGIKGFFKVKERIRQRETNPSAVENKDMLA